MEQLVQIVKCWNCKATNRLIVPVNKAGVFSCKKCGTEIIKQEVAHGYIYVLSNPSMRGLLKIGFTERTPKERIAELRGTGVPTDFVLESHFYSKHPLEDEKYIHGSLNEYRVNDKREFFKVDLKTACTIIEKRCERIN